jgi:mono/diheme cytochrome c family protein
MVRHKSILTVAFTIVMAMMSGCHLDMYDQPKFKPLSANPFFADSMASRPLVEGTVARGDAERDELLYTGKINGRVADVFPFPITRDVLARGQDRYNVFCSPCHSKLGDGRGMIVQRGFPAPASYHADSIRSKPVGFYFDVITNGYGKMFNYASSVSVRDRWAVIAYIRALQESRRVRISELPPDERKRLEFQK